MAKAAIVQNFNKNELVRYYFECHFDVLESDTLTEIFNIDKFKELDIKQAVRNLGYPNLLFSFAEGKKRLKFRSILWSHPSIQTKFMCKNG